MLGKLIRNKLMAIPHNSKCRYGERGAADAKPKAQIILDAALFNSETANRIGSGRIMRFCPEAPQDQLKTGPAAGAVFMLGKIDTELPYPLIL